jgi:4-amino-4-deoxy-L-arabinose transferase-like glycosyltransferase
MRQSDTANYIWDYYQNGIDLSKPSVCWMGNHKTVILEFPIIEAFIASSYHIFGPSHIPARIILLLFFIGSCWFLYKIICFFLDRSVARITTLLYTLMPLSLFYSRAVHIDFSEMFFVFGMVYFFLIGIQKEKILSLLLGSIFCTLALLIKTPYAFVVVFPLAWYILSRKKVVYVLKHIYLFLLPIGIYLTWQNHVFETNSAAPNWDFVPGYRKFTFDSGWYFGAFKQRIDPNNWIIIWERFYNEILGVTGFIFFIIGLFRLQKKHLFFFFWLLGTIIYLLLFFNLNRVHNYYQIPFIPILSLFIALGFQTIIRNFNNSIKNILIFIFIIIFGFESIHYSEKNYYNVQELHLEIGKVIKQNTLPTELVIINFENYDSKCPNFHYAAKRNGWVIPEWGLKGNVIYKLMIEKASYFATVRKDELNEEMTSFLAFFPSKKIELPEGYSLILFETNFKYLWDIMPEEEKEMLIEKGITYQ